MSRDWLEQEHRRYRELLSAEPQVLAGPIVRRADVNGITIFLATNRRVSVTATAHRFERDGRRTGPLGETRTTSRQIGVYLHVTLLTILPNDPSRQKLDKPFPVSTPIGYELSLSFEHDPPKPLRDFLKVELAYPPFSLPTIVLDRDPTPLLAHASCRKFHGAGFDALVRLDDEMKLALGPRSNRARPTALFLTGDQIYADDVPEPLIDTIIVLGTELMGYAEKIPGARTPENPLYSTCADLRCGIRASRLQEFFGQAMTSGLVAGRNQLISFGEFAAAYMLAWGDLCWPQQFPDRPPCALGHETIASFDKRTKLDPPYERQVDLVNRYRMFVGQIRRALANIPTYMIMDDHEVTDDWNISGDWVDNVERDYLARRVVSNAMAAYWCFQAQGNHPQKFRVSEGFFDYLEVLRTGSDLGRTAGAEKTDWTYVAPTLPPVLVLNTRTRRDFGEDKKKRRQPPALMTDEALQRARGLYASEGRHSSEYPLVVVSPVPVLGPGAVEPVQGVVGKVLGYSSDRSLAYTLDPEAWSLNAVGLGKLLAMLSGIGADTCVILSGDVHYGCVLHGAYRPGRSSNLLRIIQFTSSGSRNANNWALAFPMLHGVIDVYFEGERYDINNPPASTLTYAFAGETSIERTIRFRPPLLRFMTSKPNTVFDRNIGLVSFEADGAVGCRFLTIDEQRRTGDVTIEIPKEKPNIEGVEVVRL